MTERIARAIRVPTQEEMRAKILKGRPLMPGETISERILRNEVDKLRSEISQKQKRENKMSRELEWYRMRAGRLGLELEATRSILKSMCLPRKELAEVGRELLRTFGETP